MPIKLIGTIILLILVTIFAGVNLDNKCDITFIIHTFKDVPVFMTVIISFAIGLIVMLPFTFGRRKRKAPKVEAKNVESSSESKKAETESKTLFDFKIKRDASPEKSGKKEKKSIFGRKKKSASSERASSDGAKSGAEETSQSAAHSDDESTGAPV